MAILKEKLCDVYSNYRDYHYVGVLPTAFHWKNRTHPHRVTVRNDFCSHHRAVAKWPMNCGRGILILCKRKATCNRRLSSDEANGSIHWKMRFSTGLRPRVHQLRPTRWLGRWQPGQNYSGIPSSLAKTDAVWSFMDKLIKFIIVLKNNTEN